MAYTRVNWENLPSTKTPLNATNLNKMDEGIANNENYSTNEQKIGKWIDGKPLYRKVYQSSEFSNKYNIPINNINKLVDINGMLKRSDYNIYCKIPYRTGEASWNTSFGNINITNTIIETNIIYGSSFSASNFSNIVIIVEYTKTTD